jgi:hypothetical protein
VLATFYSLLQYSSSAETKLSQQADAAKAKKVWVIQLALPDDLIGSACTPTCFPPVKNSFQPPGPLKKDPYFLAGQPHQSHVSLSSAFLSYSFHFRLFILLSGIFHFVLPPPILHHYLLRSAKPCAHSTNDILPSYETYSYLNCCAKKKSSAGFIILFFAYDASPIRRRRPSPSNKTSADAAGPRIVECRCFCFACSIWPGRPKSLEPDWDRVCVAEIERPVPAYFRCV